MAQETPFSPLSPHSSSGGVESLRGTPDTRVTLFSPDDGSSNSSRLAPSTRHPSSATPPKRGPVCGFSETLSPLSRDPFVTPGRGKGLSPTASAFQPFSRIGHDTGGLSSVPVSTALSTDLGFCRTLAVSHRASLSVTDIEAWLKELSEQGMRFHGNKVVQSGSGDIFVRFEDIRDACSVHDNSPLTRQEWNVEFATDERTLKSDSLPCEISGSSTGQCIIFAAVHHGSNMSTVANATEVVRKYAEIHGRLFAFVRLSTSPDGSFRAIAEFCSTSAVFSAVTAVTMAPFVEGVHLTMSLYNPDTVPADGFATSLQSMSLADTSYHLARPQASDSTFTPRPLPTAHHPSAIAMYPMLFRGPFSPGLPYMMNCVPNVPNIPNAGQTSPLTPLSSNYPATGPLYQTPPSPALTSQNDQSPTRSLAGYGRPDARRQYATRVNRSPHQNATSHHNHVDIHRIREGIDVRTTVSKKCSLRSDVSSQGQIMLRNIPNKVDQAMLKRIIDESSWGKYDFMYLRIDFANDCNVGYAFINFVDPLDIIDFVDARGNQRWNCFKSDKVAEISYATIQGKDCLVQKFRNSSVMLEAPHYRPKLFFTSNGPIPEQAGQEEPFPEPDNQSKMKRSCENAEHVGLFTPNAGQHFRDEQRRRRSQYDRGTRLAALEEYDYEAAIHHLYGQATK